MSDFFLDKELITNRILKIINPSFTDSDQAVALFRWWKNIRKGGGLRLTDEGDSAFILADLQYHEVSIDSTMFFGYALLQMEKYLLCPYYLTYKNRTIRLYDQRIAIMIELHGNFVKYLNSLEVSRQQLTHNK